MPQYYLLIFTDNSANKKKLHYPTLQQAYSLVPDCISRSLCFILAVSQDVSKVLQSSNRLDIFHQLPRQKPQGQ